MPPAARLTLVPLALAALLFASCGDGGTAAGPSTTAAPGGPTSTTAAGTPPSALPDLEAIYGPPLAAMGLRLTRAAVNQFDAGPHLALYVVPEGEAAAAGAQGYVDRIVPSVAAIQPMLFARFPGLNSFDICQEPVQAAGAPPDDFPPPVTVLLMTRAQFETVPDWGMATLADALRAAEVGDGGEIDVNPELARLEVWRSAEREAAE